MNATPKSRDELVRMTKATLMATSIKTTTDTMLTMPLRGDTNRQAADLSDSLDKTCTVAAERLTRHFEEYFGGKDVEAKSAAGAIYADKGNNQGKGGWPEGSREAATLMNILGPGDDKVMAQIEGVLESNGYVRFGDAFVKGGQGGKPDHSLDTGAARTTAVKRDRPERSPLRIHDIRDHKIEGWGEAPKASDDMRVNACADKATTAPARELAPLAELQDFVRNQIESAIQHAQSETRYAFANAEQRINSRVHSFLYGKKAA